MCQGEGLVPLVTGCRELYVLYPSLGVCYIGAVRAMGVLDPSLEVMVLLEEVLQRQQGRDGSI